MTPIPIPRLNPRQARLAGYWALTSPYKPSQQQMLERALADLMANGVPCCLVAQWKGVEIWRKGRNTTPKHEVKPPPKLCMADFMPIAH